MTKSEPLRISQNDGVLTLTLNHPDFANALSPQLVEDLLKIFKTAMDVRLCVIQGQGKHFCAGFDLSDIESLSDGDLLWRFVRIETMLQAIYHAPFPTIVFAKGQVVGAGADLFAACWKRIAAPGSKFRMPGWNFGLALGTRRLAQRVGEDIARDMLIDTKIITAEQGVNNGLVSEIAESEDWPEEISILDKRSQNLSPRALENLFELTVPDTRDVDMAALVNSAAVPGLRQRILAYREKAKVAKN